MSSTTLPMHPFIRRPEGVSLFLLVSLSLHALALLGFLSSAVPKVDKEWVEVELYSGTTSSVAKKTIARTGRAARPRPTAASSDGELPKRASSLPESTPAESTPGPGTSAAPTLTVFGEDSVDVPAKLLTNPKLKYPPAALRAGQEADVAMSLTVDTNGRVIQMKLIRSAGGGFDEAASEAAAKLHFAPAEKKGSKVAVRMLWTCRFRIEG